ncbi:MAG: prenyltransferase [Methanomassiliicoccales archaeon]|nr:prenyltransferase [Methanomassiliicoccales archaeon]
MSSGRSSKARLILRLARLHFLIPGILLYILGSLLAWQRGAPIDLMRFVLGYAIFAPAHLSVSFSNDFFDREADRSAERTVLSGGSGVLVQEPSLAKFAVRFAIGLIVLSLTMTLAFALAYHMPLYFVPFVIFGALLGWFYSAPPLRLAYRGWGEVSTALASGFIMPGMGYLSISGSLDIWFVVLSVPLLCYGLFFILTVETPDEESDRRSGKNGYLVRHGLRRASELSVVATGAGTLLLLFLSVMFPGTEYRFLWPLVPLSVLPLGAALIWRSSGPTSRKKITRQVMLNFASMMLFLVLADALLALPMFA